jgi:uncharacterized protein YbjT (DUF2867 family)
MYTILGATGHIGSVIAKELLEQGEKVRAVGRSTARLQPLVQKGAEPFIADVNDTGALTRALTGVRAAFLMIPPNPSSQDYRADQGRVSDSIAAAVKNSGLHYAVHLSSYGAQANAGSGPIVGLHFAEMKLNAIDKLNVLHLRPAYFFENHMTGIKMIQMMDIFGGPLRTDLKIPMIASCDVGDHAAERLLKLDFNGKQTRELLGERDMNMNEVAAIIGKGLCKQDLLYVQFASDQVQEVMVREGMPPKTAALYIEMFQGFNDGIVKGTEKRSAENTTPTTFETFVKEVFVPAYHAKAAIA